VLGGVRILTQRLDQQKTLRKREKERRNGRFLRSGNKMNSKSLRRERLLKCRKKTRRGLASLLKILRRCSFGRTRTITQRLREGNGGVKGSREDKGEKNGGWAGLKRVGNTGVNRRRSRESVQCGMGGGGRTVEAKQAR